MNKSLFIAVSCLCMGLAQSAFTQAPYPNRPVIVISPLGSGGAVELVGRAVTQIVGERLGQSFVIDPRTGAGGTIGYEMVAKAKPDGYTLTLAGSGYTVSPALYAIRYDPVNDLTPVSQMTLGAYLLIATTSLPAKSMKEMIALAKQKPGFLNYASTGGGSIHFATEALAESAGIKLTHVPYKNLGQGYVDLIAGQIHLMMSNAISATPHVRTGKAKALAVTSPKRVPSMPDVPTVAESGIPGFEAYIWTGIMAPSKVPADIMTKLNSEIVKVVNDPAFLSRYAADAGVPILPLAEFKESIKQEIETNKRIAQTAKIKLEN